MEPLLDSQPFTSSVPPQALVAGLLRYRFSGPFGAFLRAQVNAPYDVQQAPYPESARQGALALIGLEYSP